VLSSLYHRRNLKTQQSPVILHLCLRKIPAGESRDYRDVTIFEKLHFQNVFHPHENAKPVFSNSSGLKSVLEKLRFRDGLVWTFAPASVFKFLRSRVLRWTGSKWIENRYSLRAVLISLTYFIFFYQQFLWFLQLHVRSCFIKWSQKEWRTSGSENFWPPCFPL